MDVIIEEDERIENFETIQSKNKNTLPEIALKRVSQGDLDEAINKQNPASNKQVHIVERPNYILELDNSYNAASTKRKLLDSHDADLYPETGRTVKHNYARDEKTLPPLKHSTIEYGYSNHPSQHWNYPALNDSQTYQPKPLKHIKINDHHLHYASEMSDHSIHDVNRTLDYERMAHKVHDHHPANKYSPNNYAAKIRKVNPA